MRWRWPLVWRSRYDKEIASWTSRVNDLNHDLGKIMEHHRLEKEGLFKELREAIDRMNWTRATRDPSTQILSITMSVTDTAWHMRRFRQELLESMFKEMIGKIKKATGE